MKLAGKFAFHHVFGSHMVLQRDRRIVLSGTASRGQSVLVTFDQTTKRVKAGRNGIWQAAFPALPAGGPHTITLSGDVSAEKIVLEDVLIGEVWICSGQSNMEMPVHSDTPFWYTKNAEEEVRNADYPEIRLLDVRSVKRLAPQAPEKDIPEIPWNVCSPETVAPFSACAYFFGRKLYQDLKIPVGLISACAGGTDILTWIPRKALAAGKVRPVNGMENSWQKKVAAYKRDLQTWFENFETCGKMPQEWLNPEFDDSSWNDAEPKTLLPEVGRYCMRVHFDLPGEFTGKDAELEVGFINDTDISYLNGTEIGRTQTDTPNYYMVKRTYPVRKGILQKGGNILILVGENHLYSGEFNLIMKLHIGETVLPLKCTQKLKAAFTLPPEAPLRPSMPDLEPNYPATFYNSMLAPLTRFAARGYLWYQGCFNNGQLSYYDYHKRLIESLRADRKAPDMPFLLVQLAGFDTPVPEHRLDDESMRNKPFLYFHPYALTREIQAEMPHLFKNVGMISAIDAGDHSDIHPRDKQTIGLRLALKAEKMVYGRKIAADSPEFKRMSVCGYDVRIEFDNASSGLVTADGKPPRGFWWVDRNGNLHPAENIKIKGNTVTFRTKFVPEAVRYAFTGWCDVNLTNREGFPVLPFRTDKPDYKAMFN